MSGSKVEGSSAPVLRRDPYEVLNVSMDSSDQEIKTAYRKLALKYHPDKNVNNHEASELFKVVAYSYSILSDPEKIRQYDNSGFEAIDADGMDKEIDLSNLGTVNTVFAALFSKLDVPIKTAIYANVLEEAMNGTVTVRPQPDLILYSNTTTLTLVYISVSNAGVKCKVGNIFELHKTLII